MSMVYTSTRGGAAGVSWEEAIVSGYAPDGGLYVPAEIPQVSVETLAQWADLSFVELCVEVNGGRGSMYRARADRARTCRTEEGRGGAQPREEGRGNSLAPSRSATSAAHPMRGTRGCGNELTGGPLQGHVALRRG